jgi:hypothetical protein
MKALPKKMDDFRRGNVFPWNQRCAHHSVIKTNVIENDPGRMVTQPENKMKSQSHT